MRTHRTDRVGFLRVLLSGIMMGGAAAVLSGCATPVPQPPAGMTSEQAITTIDKAIAVNKDAGPGRTRTWTAVDEMHASNDTWQAIVLDQTVRNRDDILTFGHTKRIPYSDIKSVRIEYYSLYKFLTPFLFVLWDPSTSTEAIVELKDGTEYGYFAEHRWRGFLLTWLFRPFRPAREALAYGEAFEFMRQQALNAGPGAK